MRIFQKYWVVIGILVMAALVLSACEPGQLLAPNSEPTLLPVVTQAGKVEAEGRIIPLRSVTLSFPTGGEIGELLVTEGETVEQGAVLARLAKSEQMEAAVSQAAFEQLSARQALDALNDTADFGRTQITQNLVEARRGLIEAQKSFDDLDTDDFRDELDDLRIAVQDAQDELDDAQEELDKYQDLDVENPTRKNAQTTFDNAQSTYNDALYDRDVLQNQLDQAEAALALASARVDDLERQLEKRESGPDADERDLAQARVDFAEAQLAAAERALANWTITAPYPGTVLDLYDLEPGETVQPAMRVMTLADFSTWMIETRDLTELDVVDVEVGQQVEVTPDALPELTLNGSVESISSTFSERSGDILYTVRIRLQEGDPRLRWGMTVTVSFLP